MGVRNFVYGRNFLEKGSFIFTVVWVGANKFCSQQQGAKFLSYAGKLDFRAKFFVHRGRNFAPFLEGGEGGSH